MEFPDRLAATLNVPLDPATVDVILDLARDVAHGTERRFAPLTAYVVGAYVAVRTAAGAEFRDAVAEAQHAVADLLGGDA